MLKLQPITECVTRDIRCYLILYNEEYKIQQSLIEYKYNFRGCKFEKKFDYNLDITKSNINKIIYLLLH